MTHSLKPTLAIIRSTHKNNLGNDTPIFIVQKKNSQFFLSVILVRDTGNIYTNLYLTFFLILRYVKYKKKPSQTAYVHDLIDGISFCPLQSPETKKIPRLIKTKQFG